MSEKRKSSLLGKITILVMVGLCVNAAMALDGSGTQEDPWLIQSLEDFNDFAADANYWDEYTRLETDVNLAGRTYTTAVIAPDVNNVNHWFQGTPFTGVFDGNDHKITGLTIDDGGANNDYLGVFGRIDVGQVMNLGIEGGFVSGEYNVGGLVGENLGIVSNCYYTGDVSGADYVGGLVGRNGFVVYFPTFSAKVGYIYNSYSTGSVQGDSLVGGLVGLVIIGDISNCYSIGDVNGDYAGGLVGGNKGIVSNCYATGDVSGGHEVGGLVGKNGEHSGGYPGTDPGYIHNSYSTGAVQGNSSVGGLVGQNRFGTVSNCYSTGFVSGDYDVGGLVGRHFRSTISNCYSTGDVNGVYTVGGIVGWNWVTGIVSNCFWDTDTQTHGTTDSFGYNEGTVTNVAGLPTFQLHQQSTFSNWDFTHTWNIGENQTYPYLRVYLAGDINKDRIVNFLDLSITANQWIQEQ